MSLIVAVRTSVDITCTGCPPARGGHAYAGVRCFFFFQAEDGIRDLTVTGVQTCALPIFAQNGVSKAVYTIPTSFTPGKLEMRLVFDFSGIQVNDAGAVFFFGEFLNTPEIGRASCRKECRSRWSPYH